MAAWPFAEWPSDWPDGFAVFVVDAETVAQWLIDHPIED
jgi:hypothetical protein